MEKSNSHQNTVASSGGSKKEEPRIIVRKIISPKMLGEAVGAPHKVAKGVLAEKRVALSSSTDDFVSSPEVNRKRERSMVGKENIADNVICRNILVAKKQVANIGKGGEASIRSSFTPVLSLISEIKPKLVEAHMKEFKKSPFRHLVLCFLNGHIKEEHVVNVGSDFRKLAQCFNAAMGQFEFGGKVAKPEIDDFRCHLGIEDGTEEVVISNKFKQSDFYWRQAQFVSRRGEDKRLNSNIVKAQLISTLTGANNEHTHKDVARLLTLYLMSALLLTPTSGHMPWAWVEMLDDYDNCKKFNWSKYILQVTMNSLEKNQRQFGGCPLVLLFWLCENTTIMPCINTRFWPRLLKWNLSELSRLIKNQIIQIDTMKGFKWIGAPPICFCEWEKLDFAAVSTSPDPCTHSGDTYTGEEVKAAPTSDEVFIPECSSEGGCFLCLEGSHPPGYSIRKITKDKVVYVKDISSDSDDFNDNYDWEATPAEISDENEVSSKYVAPGNASASLDGLTTTPVNKCLPSKDEGGTVEGEKSTNPFSHESLFIQELFGWGKMLTNADVCTKLAFSPIDLGYEADEGELPDVVYESLCEQTERYIKPNLDSYYEIYNDETPQMCQTYGYEYLNTEFLSNMSYSMREVVRYLEGLGAGNPISTMEVAREFFHRKIDVDLLRARVKDLEGECVKIGTLENELYILNIEHKSLKTRCNCKEKALKPKIAKFFKRSGGNAPRKRNLATDKNEKESAMKLNSLIRGVKERANRRKKRISGYTYHSHAMLAKKTRARRVKPNTEIVTGNVGAIQNFNEVSVPEDRADFMEKLEVNPNRERVTDNVGALHNSKHHAGNEDIVLVPQDRANFMEKLENIKNKSGDSGQVWVGSIAGDPVIVKEAEGIQKGGDIVDTVVNGWGEVIDEQNDEVKIVNAGCHAFITHVSENDQGAKLYVDPILEKFRNCRLMLFPLNPTGRHWTLLVFDLVKKKWLHYNSLLPADERDDLYLESAYVVKEYVETKILEIIARDRCGTEFARAGAVECVRDAPQQAYGTVDCGIFVCIIMERLVVGMNPTDAITQEDVGKYRNKMVKVFVERGMNQAREDEAHPKLVTNQRA